MKNKSYKIDSKDLDTGIVTISMLTSDRKTRYSVGVNVCDLNSKDAMLERLQQVANEYAVNCGAAEEFAAALDSLEA